MPRPLSALKKRVFRSPPKIEGAQNRIEEKKTGESQDTKDALAPARYRDKKKIRLAQIALQLGLAGNALSGTFNPAQAQALPVQEQMMETPSLQETVDLAIPEEQKNSLENFQALEFEQEDAVTSLETFAEEGRVYIDRTLGSDKDVSPSAAAERLSKGKSVHIELIDGSVEEISNLEEMQAFDTFHGLGLKPVAPPEVVRALQGLELGVDGDDGLVRGEFGLSEESSFKAYDAYRVLSGKDQKGMSLTVKGALIGGGIVVAGVGAVALGGHALLPSMATAVAGASGVAVAGAAIAVGAGVAAGGYMGSVANKEENPEELEVRYGTDAGLKVKSLEHAVDAYNWLQERAANPFTEEQQDVAIHTLDESFGFFVKGERVSLDEVKERLAKGENIEVPSSIAGHSDVISNMRELQQLDTVRGSGVNPVLAPHVSASLRDLESGSGPADGLYKAGNFEAEGRLSAFEAVDYLFKERQEINAVVKGKQYETGTLENVQELNALMGDGVNTILPQDQFDALQKFGSEGLMTLEAPAAQQSQNRRAAPKTESAPETVDAYEALQLLRNGKDLRIQSRGRAAKASSLADLHELKSLEFDRSNSIVSDRDFELLNHWDSTASFKVDQDGEADYAYEALQALQAGQTFSIEHRGRDAQVASTEDMVELAALETPDAGFEHQISDRDYKLLQHWEKTGGYEVTFAQDYAYEALQSLQAGGSFRIQHRDRSAVVTSITDMVELAALETPDAGFEHNIPDTQYKLLKHWETVGHYKVEGSPNQFAYEGLQALQQGHQFDIHSNGRYAPVSSIQDMAELAAFETPDAGFEHEIPADEFARLSHFEKAGQNATTRVAGREGRAYEGYRALRGGQRFEVNAGGVWNTVTSSDSLHDLDALLGRQVNDILPQDQYDHLKHLGDEQSGEGLSIEGQRLNSYSALQRLRDGKHVNYDFVGGDFSERLIIKNDDLESLGQTRQLRDNQKEYDQYAYSASDWADKMGRQADSLPGLADDNRDYAVGRLRAGQSDLSDAESDLSSAESDLRRAKSDLSSAESDLRSARSELSSANSMPDRVKEEYEVCDDTSCWWEEEYVNNDAKDSAVRDARSWVRDAEGWVSDAESDIRRARSDISDAESDIDDAEAAIRRARGLISEADQLIGALPGYQNLLNSTTEQNLSQSVSQAKERLAQFKNLTHINKLQSNLDRQGVLINNHQSRPARPAGWEAPSELVQF